MGRHALPPLARVWAGARFAHEVDPDQDEPEIFAAAGETPLLVLPVGLTPAQVDKECGYAIARLFLDWYGEERMIECIRAWPRLVAYVEHAGDIAAD